MENNKEKQIAQLFEKTGLSAYAREHNELVPILQQTMLEITLPSNNIIANPTMILDMTIRAILCQSKVDEVEQVRILKNIMTDMLC